MFMTLAPGEVFEHTHRDHSVTMLVEGAVEIEVNGSRTALAPGLPTPIDAHLPHVLINIGPSPAVVECVHPPIG